MTVSSAASKSFVSSAALFVLLSAAALRAQVEWVDARPTAQRGLGAVAMAFDENRGHMLKYGGVFQFFVSDETWAWNGNGWAQRFPATNPGKRAFHSMVYDAVRGRMVVYGGHDNLGVLLGDTWEWDGSNWAQRFPATSPGDRFDHAMVYDAARGRIVLFGGRLGSVRSPTRPGNTTAWTWTQLFPRVSPTLRSAITTMAYDAARQRVVVFGGLTGPGRPQDRHLGIRRVDVDPAVPRPRVPRPWPRTRR